MTITILGIEFDVWKEFDIAIDFEIDIENVRNTRYRDHGEFNEEGITEIAIYKFDGHEIVDQFISLVNEIPIQPFVVKLTGINNAMLTSAPSFLKSQNGL
jgi:DNA polymerase-3 subunit epsilon